MREARVEAHLRAQVEGAGGICIKLSPAGLVGIPDRLVVLPGGWICFAEVKKPKGGRIGRLQHWWRARLMDLGCRHRFVLTREDVEELLGAWRTA